MISTEGEKKRAGRTRSGRPLGASEMASRYDFFSSSSQCSGGPIDVTGVQDGGSLAGKESSDATSTASRSSAFPAYFRTPRRGRSRPGAAPECGYDSSPSSDPFAHGLGQNRAIIRPQDECKRRSNGAPERLPTASGPWNGREGGGKPAFCVRLENRAQASGPWASGRRTERGRATLAGREPWPGACRAVAQRPGRAIPTTRPTGFVCGGAGRAAEAPRGVEQSLPRTPSVRKPRQQIRRSRSHSGTNSSPTERHPATVAGCSLFSPPATSGAAPDRRPAARSSRSLGGPRRAGCRPSGSPSRPPPPAARSRSRRSPGPAGWGCPRRR